MIFDLMLSCIALAFAALAYPALSERLAQARPPKLLRGLPITLITGAFAALAVDRALGGHAIAAIATFLGIATAFALSTIRSHRHKPAPSIEQIDQLLPQTQCGQCGYPGCLPYATAIASGEADINHCPPGGIAGVQALARLTGRESKPLNPANGVEKPKAVALIREPECIGCTKCIQACPVDAIVGASKSMHVVIADLCTGCELCIPPCPVDCIDLIPA
jgi:electron transport complex protein RnfB